MTHYPDGAALLAAAKAHNYEIVAGTTRGYNPTFTRGTVIGIVGCDYPEDPEAASVRPEGTTGKRILTRETLANWWCWADDGSPCGEPATQEEAIRYFRSKPYTKRTFVNALNKHLSHVRKTDELAETHSVTLVCLTGVCLDNSYNVTFETLADQYVWADNFAPCVYGLTPAQVKRLSEKNQAIFRAAFAEAASKAVDEDTDQDGLAQVKTLTPDDTTLRERIEFRIRTLTEAMALNTDRIAELEVCNRTLSGQIGLLQSLLDPENR